MLYELIAVVRPGNLKEIKEIATIVGSQVLQAGGVVRGISNWGAFRLPKPVTRHQSRYQQGHYFIVRFDSSSQTQDSVQRTLKLDPRMIRYSVIKLGSKLDEIKDIGGKVEWNQGYQAEPKQGRLALG